MWRKTYFFDPFVLLITDGFVPNVDSMLLSETSFVAHVTLHSMGAHYPVFYLSQLH